MTIKKNFEIGNLCLYNNIIYAPLTEYTDFAFRRFLRFFHKGLFFCEMVKMEAVIKKKSLNILKYTPDMKPIGAQIWGSDAEIASDVAKKIEDLGFDLIDLNCGCPVPKVLKDKSGAALLKQPKLIYSILSKMVSAVQIPVTVKIRIGPDDFSICALEILKIAKEAGCSAITIHGRTTKQGYSGSARWDHIKECKSQSKDILVIGNGSLFTSQDIKNMFQYTKCDGAMIARGLLYNPALSQDIEKNASKRSNGLNFDKNALFKYFDYVIEEKGLKKALLDIKKISGWLLRDVKNAKQLRIKVNIAKSTNEAIEIFKMLETKNEYE